MPYKDYIARLDEIIEDLDASTRKTEKINKLVEALIEIQINSKEKQGFDREKIEKTLELIRKDDPQKRS